MRDNRKKILCIEDDHETVELIAEELIDCGFDVQITYMTQRGYSPTPNSLPDVVLCDINMPPYQASTC
jgi:DNA-binding response OmpR family regulator